MSAATAATAGGAVTVRAPAKVNLHLGVGAPRADGYHPLVTVYQALDLADEVTAAPAGAWSVVVTGDGVDVSNVPLGEDNLVAKAARALTGGSLPPVAVRIAKRIPVAGGMAGGSADAAAALVALDRLLGRRTPRARLLELAAGLGSDVPFALVGGTAIGSGRGEVVRPLADAGTGWSWVVLPSVGGLSTPAVYRRFDELRPGAPERPAPAEGVLEALATGDPHRLAAVLHNDLQPAALDLRSELAGVLEAGEAAGALAGLVSGSGPTCVFLAGSAGHAGEVASRLRAAGHRPVLTASGPAPGALASQAPRRAAR